QWRAALPHCNIAGTMKRFARNSAKYPSGTQFSRMRGSSHREGRAMKRPDASQLSGPWPPGRQGMYDPVHEHDACGLGFVAHIKGRKSHAIIEQGLKILVNLTHRGATGADPLQGDGAGILIQLPDAFFRRACGKLGITLPAIGQYGVGMVFLPQEPASRMACEQEIERAIHAEGQLLLGWRDVPTRNAGLSERTKEVEPVIRQVFVARGGDELDQNALER